jgi:S1-C subfamily serine protease
MASLKSLALGVVAVVLGLAANDGQHRPEVIERGKRATAFVQVVTSEGRSSGSGFCIDRSGLFITNAHVVDRAADGRGQVWLVVDIGRKTQRRLRSKVLKTDSAYDLALLQVDGGGDLNPLELGTEDALIETMPITTFGFPFGEMLKGEGEAYPEITIIASRITSLRRDKDRLVKIQFDGQINRGNSGGPVLDEAGRVVGVAVQTVEGAAINLSVPVGRLSEFLEAPTLVFNPPTLHYKDRGKSATWIVNVQPSKPGAELPEKLSVEATIANGVDKERSFQGREVRDGVFQVNVRPVSQDSSRKVDLLVRLPNGQAFPVQVLDRDLTVGRQKLLLSDVQALFAGSPPRAVTRRGPVLNGPIAGLGKVSVPVGMGAKKRMINLTEAARIDVRPLDPGPDVQAIGALVQLRQGSKVLATVARRIDLAGVPSAPAPNAIAIRIGDDIFVLPIVPQAPADPRSRLRPGR